MYPPQTSFIPIQIALARFLESQGWTAFFSPYPYWYLGSTPFFYLTGPVLPSLLVIAHKIFPSLSLFEVFWGILGGFWVIGGIGVYFLVKELANSGSSRNSFRGRTSPEVRPPQGVALLSAGFYLFGPITPFLFRFSDGIGWMSFSLIPWTLGWYARWLGNAGRGRTSREVRPPQGVWGLLGLMTLVLLVDVSVFPTLFLGMAAVFLAVAGWKRAEEKLKQSFLILFFAFFASTLWYSPGYWRQLLIAPSFAGQPLFKVISQLTQLLPAALAIGLAIVSGKLFKLKQSQPKAGQPLAEAINYQLSAKKFSFYWLFIFGFLTLMRFAADPDFWLDWSSYGVELQMGIGIALGLTTSRLLRRNQKPKTKNANQRLVSLWLKKHILKNAKILMFLICVFSFLFFIFYFTFDKYVLGTLQPDITQAVEYRIGSQLVEIAKPGEKVFLSGSTVFWLNAFFEVAQVRGGVDQASVHPDWRQAAWEIREGATAKAAEKWLKTLNISYLVVHTEESEEYWHDFKHPEKFEGVEGLEKVYDEKGDRIYKIKY